jgi:hypothetical protein
MSNTTATVTDAAAAERARIVDLAVRYARESGLCSEFERALDRLLPEERDDDTGTWLDSDGRGCRGEEWRDEDGFNREGFDGEGYDHHGFNADGRDRQGFDRDGFDRHGLHRDDPARYTRNRSGRTREEVLEGWSFQYDRDGFDSEGWSSSGYNRNGQYSEAKDGYYHSERR